jgi:GntP family gluconate:H+ symporter
MYPFMVLAVGMAVVLGSIVLLRVNAFLALLASALVVSAMVGGREDPVARVVAAFGSTAAAIGIVIALAAVIGEAMMHSGAADRIVRAALAVLGEKRGPAAMMTSGFILSIPVFFDTAFYLLVPLVRSLYRSSRKRYVEYLVAVAAGAAATHAMVPPTPGPLFMANVFEVNVGLAILIGIVVALPSAIAGLVYGAWIDRHMPVTPSAEILGEQPGETLPAEPENLPGLALSLAPIVLPIVLITGSAVVSTLAHQELIAADPAARLLRGGALDAAILAAGEAGSRLGGLFAWTNVLGNPNLALFFSAIVALLTLWVRRAHLKEAIPVLVERGLMSGGVIILITAAGGAFGAMLRAAGLGEAIQGLAQNQVAGGSAGLSGLPLLLLAFAVASVIKFAQGSSTTSMIVTSGMIVAMIDPARLSFNPVYVATAIGAGSLVGSWMNDSGFWIFAKMGGLTEVETLKSWTPVLVVVGGVTFAMTLLLAIFLPLTG